MNKHVVSILESLGVQTDGGKTAHQIIAETDKPKVHPRIAALLGESGIIYEAEDVMGGENTPLDAPGSAPLYNQGAQGQQAQPQQTSGVRLKDKNKGEGGIELDKTGGTIETVDDLAGKMAEISETMRLVDLTIQTLKTNAKDTSLKAHKNRFRDDIEHLHKLTTRLRNAMR